MERDDPHDELVRCSTPDSAAHPYRHTPSSLVLFPRIRAEKLQDDTNLALETTHTDSLLQHRRSRSRSLPDSSTGNNARACRTSCKAGCRSRRQALSPTPAKLDAANPIMRRVVFPSRAGDHGDAEVMGITACTASRSSRSPPASEHIHGEMLHLVSQLLHHGRVDIRCFRWWRCPRSNAPLTKTCSKPAPIRLLPLHVHGRGKDECIPSHLSKQ